MKRLLLVGLAGLLIVGFWLRWQFVVRVSPDVDELTTLWATRRILTYGIPWMPSATLYSRGLLNSYTIAAFALVGGLTTTIGRLPSVIFGLLTILLLWWIGWRLWNGRVAMLAAAGWAFLPEAVQADGHARFYTQHVFLTLLTLWLTYQALRTPGTQERERAATWRAQLLVALAFGLAIFTQEETLLLYPTLVLSSYLWRGWRYFRQPPVLVAQLLCLVFIGLRYLLEQLGQPGYFAAIQSHKAYFDFNFDVRSAWQVYGPLYIAPARVGWTALGLTALLVSLLALWRNRKKDQPQATPDQAVLFFALPFLFILAALLTVVGNQWRADRYLLFVQPCWLLVGAAGANWWLERLPPHRLLHWGATSVVAGLLFLPFWPAIQFGLLNQTEGYDAAFAYVAAHRQAHDLVITPQPPACAALLAQPCDFYARERGYEPYVTMRQGVLVDRWSGAPWLSTAEQLQTVLKNARAQGQQVWFVSDSYRLGKLYNAAFIQTIIEQFNLVFTERGVNVLHAAGWHAEPAYRVKKAFTPPVAVGDLALAQWERTAVHPGEPVHVRLLWGHPQPLQIQINTSVQVAGADGTRLTQADGPPALGMIPTTAEVRGFLPDLKTLRLPTVVKPGRYRFEVIAYEAQTHALLADPIAIDWFTVSPPPAQPELVLNAQWHTGLRLLGRDGLPTSLLPQTPLRLRLVWVTDQAIQADYTVFVHLVGPDGRIVTQQDRQPLGGFYPTSRWAVADAVEEQYVLTMPDTLAPGAYHLLVGWYQVTTQERLRLLDQQDTLELAQWMVP